MALNSNVFVGMLRQGKTGEQILNILDVIANDFAQTASTADADTAQSADVVDAVAVTA
jgi:hypothetical protein